MVKCHAIIPIGGLGDDQRSLDLVDCNYVLTFDGPLPAKVPLLFAVAVSGQSGLWRVKLLVWPANGPENGPRIELGYNVGDLREEIPRILVLREKEALLPSAGDYRVSFWCAEERLAETRIRVRCKE